MSMSSEESAARATGAAVPEKVEALGQRSSASLRTLRSTLIALQDLVAKATRVLGDPTEEILADLLVGRMAPWNRLASETEAVLGNATALLTQVGATSVELPSKVPRDRLRTDALRRRAHFRHGGRRGFGILAPQIVKETAYIEKSCLVDGRRPDSVERLASVVAYLGLDRNIHELARLWPDALPALPSWKQAVALARDRTSCAVSSGSSTRTSQRRSPLRSRGSELPCLRRTSGRHGSWPLPPSWRDERREAPGQAWRKSSMRFGNAETGPLIRAWQPWLKR